MTRWGRVMNGDPAHGRDKKIGGSRPPTHDAMGPRHEWGTWYPAPGTRRREDVARMDKGRTEGAPGPGRTESNCGWCRWDSIKLGSQAGRTWATRRPHCAIHLEATGV